VRRRKSGSRHREVGKTTLIILMFALMNIINFSSISDGKMARRHNTQPKWCIKDAHRRCSVFTNHTWLLDNHNRRLNRFKHQNLFGEFICLMHNFGAVWSMERSNAFQDLDSWRSDWRIDFFFDLLTSVCSSSPLALSG